VQPGYFYDFPAEAWLVVSLIVEPGVFEPGIEAIVAVAADDPSKWHGLRTRDLTR
jgi:hypothetical protein